MKNSAVRLCLAIMLVAGCSAAGRIPEPGVVAGQKAAEGKVRPANAASALAELLAGNKRFRSGHPLSRDRLAELQANKDDQKPFATVLSCLDSRIPPEIVFDQSIGDFFVARVAGNIENPDILASLEFATAVKGVPLVVVMGHDGCGAVAGACKGVKLGNLSSLLEQIQPAVTDVAKTNPHADHASRAFQDKVSETNVRRTLRDLTSGSQVLAKLVAEGKLKIVGAMYELGTGKVRFLD